MTTLPKTAFLGAGNMAAALVRGALERGGYRPERLAVTDVRAEAREALVQQFGVRSFDDNAAVCDWADVIVLAVKPQVLASVLMVIAQRVKARHLVVSIAAGVPISRISLMLGDHGRVVRAMPNTPALVGEAATALAKSDDVSEHDFKLAQALFAATGRVVRIDEKLMDAVTGLSGSGPAYGFVAIEALSDAGVRAGLGREVATQLAAQTLLGAAKMVLETGEHPARLKDQVASPGGTTIAGIAALERHGLRAALMAAVDAAVARSKELGA